MRNESMAARLTRLRNAAGLSKAELARRARVSDVAISYWESGEIKQIGHERLLALAVALQCTVSELVGDPMQAARDAWVAAEALESFADWLPSDYEGEEFQAGVDQARHHAKDLAANRRKIGEDAS